MSNQKRSYIEVEAVSTDAEVSNREPLQQFASRIRRKHGGTDKTEYYNTELLRNLVENRHIAKSSIIWHDDEILKIYGLTVDHDGRINYNRTRSSPERPRQYVSDATKIDLSALRNAVVRAKQMAI